MRIERVVGFAEVSVYFMENEEIDYKRVVEQLRNGESLFGKDDALTPLLKRLIEYFQYRPVIRKLIYTTNTVEGLP